MEKEGEHVLIPSMSQISKTLGYFEGWILGTFLR